MVMTMFARRLEQSGVVDLLAVDTSIWLQTATLDWVDRDPADRVIVATALQKGLPILTKDEGRKAARVQCRAVRVVIGFTGSPVEGA